MFIHQLCALIICCCVWTDDRSCFCLYLWRGSRPVRRSCAAAMLRPYRQEEAVWSRQSKTDVMLYFTECSVAISLWLCDYCEQVECCECWMSEFKCLMERETSCWSLNTSSLWFIMNEPNTPTVRHISDRTRTSGPHSDVQNQSLTSVNVLRIDFFVL